jgi:flagellin-like hook-associated protein FlgL
MTENNFNNAVDLRGDKGVWLNNLNYNSSVGRKTGLAAGNLSAKRSVEREVTLSADPHLLNYSMQKNFALSTDNFSLNRTVERSFFLELKGSPESRISKAKAGADALVVAKSAGELEPFLRSAKFVREQLPELEEKFYNSVTSIGIDSPGDLGTYLYEGMSETGIAARRGFADHVRSFMNTAQFVAEKSPGTMQSFIRASDAIFSNSPENLENFFGRVVEIASDFGSDATKRFSNLLYTTARTDGKIELIDEFFNASDAVKSLGKDLYSKFLTRMESDLESHNAHKAGIYLEYLTGLARSGDTKAAEQLLDTSISGAFDELGNFTAGGVTGTAVTGVDVLYGPNAETFGSAETSPYGLSTADTTQGDNSAGISLSSNGVGQAAAVAGVSQTFDVQAGNHFTTPQTADITLNMGYDIGYSSWNPVDVGSTIYALATAGIGGAVRAASEAAEVGVEVTAKQMLKGAVKGIVKESVKQIGKAFANEVLEDQLGDAVGNNFEGEVAVMAYLVETDPQGESTVIAGKKVDSLEVDTSALGLRKSGSEKNSNANVTFEDVTIKPGYEYSVRIYVLGSAASVSGDDTKVTGEVALDSIKINFDNDVDSKQTANVAEAEVPEHGTYTAQEVAKKLGRQSLEREASMNRDADIVEEAAGFQRLTILQQLGTYSLSTANQNPGTILNLLR